MKTRAKILATAVLLMFAAGAFAIAATPAGAATKNCKTVWRHGDGRSHRPPPHSGCGPTGKSGPKICPKYFRHGDGRSTKKPPHSTCITKAEAAKRAKGASGGGGGATAFADCAALNAVYPSGVAKSQEAADAASENGSTPSVDASVYSANSGLDEDGDGVACEA